MNEWERKPDPDHHRLASQGFRKIFTNDYPLAEEACRVMTNSYYDEQMLLSHLHTNSGFFFFFTIKYHTVILIMFLEVTPPI